MGQKLCYALAPERVLCWKCAEVALKLSLPHWVMDCFHLCLFYSGLKQIHALSIQGNYELRIDLEDFENSTAYAQYGTFGVGLFSVDPDDDGYPLTVGDYSGNAGRNTHWAS